MARMRLKTEIRDVPPAEIARHLGLDEATFDAKLPSLLARGFPPADPDTGNFDLHAVDRWQDGRHPGLFVGDTLQARDASVVAKGRIAQLRGKQ
jgi:hypothetical protein